MSRAVVCSTVRVAAPYDAVWAYLTDWALQREWIPLTRVEEGETARGLGGRFRARTGLGPVGFWDPMVVTAWQPPGAVPGEARCEVLHTGRVVRGEGEFVIREGTDPGACEVTWWERLHVPGGPVGALGWRACRGAVETGLGGVLRRMGARVEDRPSPPERE